MKIKVNLKEGLCGKAVFPSTGARANKSGLHDASLHQMLVWLVSRLAVSSMLTSLGSQTNPFSRTKEKDKEEVERSEPHSLLGHFIVTLGRPETTTKCDSPDVTESFAT